MDPTLPHLRFKANFGFCRTRPCHICGLRQFLDPTLAHLRFKANLFLGSPGPDLAAFVVKGTVWVLPHPTLPHLRFKGIFEVCRTRPCHTCGLRQFSVLPDPILPHLRFKAIFGFCRTRPCHICSLRQFSVFCRTRLATFAV